MRAPIPTREDAWWNDTDGLQEKCFCDPPMEINGPGYEPKCPLPGCQSQMEQWWTDAMLDKKATQLLADHAQRCRQAAPWFMKSNATEGPWLTEAEILHLKFEQQYRVRGSTIKIPKSLLISFSRRYKESILYIDDKHGESYESHRGFPMNDSGSVLYGYLQKNWKLKPYGSFGEKIIEDLRIINNQKGQNTWMKQEMGTEAQLMKAVETFSHWTWTGEVVLKEDEFVNKKYLLDLARALGAPLFRAAILEQLSPDSSRSFFLPRQAASSIPQVQAEHAEPVEFRLLDKAARKADRVVILEKLRLQALELRRERQTGSSSQVQAAEEPLTKEATAGNRKARRQEEKKAAKAQSKEKKKNGKV